MSKNLTPDRQANQATKPTSRDPEQSERVPRVKIREQIAGWWQALKTRLGTAGVLIIIFIVLALGSLYLRPGVTPLADPNPRVQLIVVQLNDIYRLGAVRGGKRGGLPRVVTLLRQVKAQNPNVPIIVLHAGDFLSPSLESNAFHGAQMVDAMNFINDVAPLYAVAGNHEFDYSDADKNYLTDAVLNSRFRWITSNLERNDPRLLPALRDNVSSNVIVPIGKIKLGIFGLTIHGSQSGKDRSYAPISGDYPRIAAEQIDQLERQGADVIVGLTHLNIDDDQKLATLKQNHPRFLWIAGGHEHSVDREPASPGSALITKGDSNARTIWKVSVVGAGQNLDLREESIRIDESIASDSAYAQTIEMLYQAKLRRQRPYLDFQISTVNLGQPGRCYDATEEAVRDRESDWGDRLTDTMRTAYKGVKADMAVLNGGSIRIDDFICDRITFEDLERTFAYETPVVLVKLKGQYLKQYLLEDSAGSKTGDGRFLQVSGVSFRRDLSSRSLKDLQIQSGTALAPFDDAKTYVVAVNKYLFDCGDNYKFRQFVTEYVTDGPDLRTLVYAELSGQSSGSSQLLHRINDLPGYAVARPSPVAKWQTLNSIDRQCPQ